MPAENDADLNQYAVEAAGIGSWRVDLDTLAIEWSPRCRQLFGIGPLENPSYAEFLEMLHPQDREPTDVKVQRALQEGLGYDAQYRVRIGDTYRWIGAQGSVKYDASGRPNGFFGICVDISERKTVEIAQAEHARAMQLLNELGARILREFELDKLVKLVIDSGVEVTGAAFGAFFYNVEDADGKKYMLYALAGAARADFENFPTPRATAVFSPTLSGDGIVCSGDITQDPRYGKSAPHFGMPAGHLPVRSYLAVPVISRGGGVIGGLFFGHPEPHRFGPHIERIAAGLGSYAALAFDNASLLAKSFSAESAVQRHEALMRTALHGARLIAWEYDVVNDVISYSDPQQILGITREPFTAAADWHNCIFPDDRSGHGAILAEALRENRDYVSHFRWIRPLDGKILRLEARGTVLAANDQAGQLVTGVLIDETERLAALEARLESEERFRALADNIPQLAWITDSSGSIVWYNRRWFDYTGTTFEQMRGWGWQAVHHPEHVQRVTEKYKQALATGEPWEDIFPLLGKDGIYRWFLSRATPILDDSGKVVRWFGTNTDISEQRDTEERLRRSNAELEEFAYVVSHDLQEPLRKVAIFTPLLLKAAAGESTRESAETYGTRIGSAVLRMQTLIQELLTYSRAVHEEARLDKRADLNRALKDAERVQEDAITAAGARIACEELPTVRGDESQFSLVFQNLLSNALKYRDPDRTPEISISVRGDAEGTVIAFRDNGIGFHPDYAERIFGLFKRLFKDEYPGTGLGLAICKRIVERYAGKIWAVSAGEGQGASFFIWLPRVNE